MSSEKLSISWTILLSALKKNIACDEVCGCLSLTMFGFPSHPSGIVRASPTSTGRGHLNMLGYFLENFPSTNSSQLMAWVRPRPSSYITRFSVVSSEHVVTFQYQQKCVVRNLRLNTLLGRGLRPGHRRGFEVDETGADENVI